MDDCPDADQASASVYQGSTIFKCVLLSQVFFCILTIYLTIKCILNFRHVYFHPNCKVLVRLILIGYILHSVAFRVNQFYHVFTYMFFSVCDIAVSITFCVIINSFSFFCAFLFSAVHLSLSVERIVAKIFVRRYEKMNSSLGIIFAIFSVVSGILLYFHLIEYEDYSKKTAYCELGNKRTVAAIVHILYIQTAMDFMSTTIIFVLYLLQQNKRSKVEHRLGSFNLSAAFQMIEHKQATSMLLPLTVLHCFCYTFFELLMFFAGFYLKQMELLTRRIMMTSFYIFPLYTALSCLLLLHLMRKLKSERETKMKRSIIKVTNVDEVHLAYARSWK